MCVFLCMYTWVCTFCVFACLCICVHEVHASLDVWVFCVYLSALVSLCVHLTVFQCIYKGIVSPCGWCLSIYCVKVSWTQAVQHLSCLHWYWEVSVIPGSGLRTVTLLSHVAVALCVHSGKDLLSHTQEDNCRQAGWPCALAEGHDLLQQQQEGAEMGMFNSVRGWQKTMAAPSAGCPGSFFQAIPMSRKLAWKRWMDRWTGSIPWVGQLVDSLKWYKPQSSPDTYGQG